ncbi:MAG: alpha-(1-_3)-arabinofuranosyltransferase family protein, partial [bacterium]|nr:alpha-(1->3)-arabinofuranosyltransferase family protein [bacterium]
VTYLPAGLYLILAIGKRRKSGLKIIAQTLLAALIFLALSLWYLIPSFKALREASQNSSVPNYSEIVNSGKFLDHLRLIGQWGWYEKYYLSEYVPFAKNYDRFPLLLTTYGIVFFSWLSFLLSRQRKIFLFAGGLFLLGLVLANGGKPPLGNLYLKVYNAHPFFWMFREPWAKFTPLQVFSLPILLYGALAFLQHRLTTRFIYGVSFAVSLVILINVYPIFTGEGIWHTWNGSMRSFQVAVPAYWHELKQYLVANNLQDERIITLPAARYGMAYNWEHGISTPDDVATSLLPNPTLEFSSFPTQPSEGIVNQFYNALFAKNFPLEKYLQLLNTEYLLQENDVDWRYSLNNPPPSILTRLLGEKNLTLVTTFGSLDNEFLSKIPNGEPNEKLQQALYQELLGKSALALYHLKDQKKLPLFYTPEQIISSPNGQEALPDIINFANSPPKVAIYLRPTDSPNPEPTYLPNQKILSLGEKETTLQPPCQRDCYTATAPQEGEYEIFVAKEPWSAAGGSKETSLSINDQKLFPPLNQPNSLWLHYGKVSLPQGKHYLNLTLPITENVLKDEAWQQVRIVNTSINKDTSLYPEPTIYQAIKDWNNYAFWEVSFEYQSRYGKLGLVVLEDTQEIFKTELVSQGSVTEWLKFDALIKTKGGRGGAIAFYYQANNPLTNTTNDGNFRQVQVRPIVTQKILLEQKNILENASAPSQKPLVSPQISFTKKSPAKYKIKVEGAKEPFLLVFLTNFHPDWELRLEQSGEMVANDRHLTINGYANAWYILPEDVGQQQNYTLIAEFGWQKYLRWGAMISGVALVGCLVCLLWPYRRPKPYF